MAQSQFSLCWDAHKKNICNGLSSLQQNGEFVDMTLAADGHHVKVHQVMLALASPYIKELMASIQCQHPVIFLNKISYTTLTAILEYIYTGEVVVTIDCLNELVEAGRELRIKGLEDMKLVETVQGQHRGTQKKPLMKMDVQDSAVMDDVSYFKISEVEGRTANNEQDSNNEEQGGLEDIVFYTEHEMITPDCNIKEDPSNDSPERNSKNSAKSNSSKEMSVMQYTVSNRGSLQMILNRFVYYLKHSNRDNTRQWRCVDYLASCRCPAHVVTRGDVVVKRISAHTHAFHDNKILKRVRAGAVYSAIQEAELEGQSKRDDKQKHNQTTPASRKHPPAEKQLIEATLETS